MLLILSASRNTVQIRGGPAAVIPSSLGIVPKGKLFWQGMVTVQ